MADYIKRSDAIETLTQMCWHDGDGYPVEDADEKRQYAEDWVNAIPSADVAEVRHGKWIEQEDGFGDTYYDCSCCGESFCLIEGTPTDNMYNFCPNCGADMRKDGW